MDNVVLWDAEANPIGKAIERVLYDIRTEDKDGLIYDAVTLQDVIEDSDGYLATFDALVTPYARLDRKIRQLFMVMNKAVPDFKIAEYQISKPFKQRGGVHVLVTFELMDGQAILVFFHVPTVDPKRILPTDELVSWKWMINKKDVTIVVAPEKGKDIPVREVGRRIMKLAQRNSSAFQRANEKRAERLKEISDYEKEIAELEAELASLLKQIEVAKLEHEERELKALEKTLDERVGKELIKKEGWSEVWEGNSTVLRKMYGVKELKVSLTDGEAVIVADAVNNIKDSLDFSNMDVARTVNKITEIAESLLIDLEDFEQGIITEHEQFVYELSEKLVEIGWKIKGENTSLLVKEFEGGIVKADLEKEGGVNVFVSQDYQENIMTTGENVNDVSNKVDDTAKSLLFKKASEEKIKELAEAVQKYHHIVNFLDNQNIAITTVRSESVVNVGIDDDGEYEFISREIEENYLNEHKTAMAIAYAIDEADFILKMQGEFPDDKELPSWAVQGGVFKGKSFEFAKTIETIEIAVNKVNGLTVAFGDFNHTGGSQDVLFDSVISESNPPIYGITAQIGYTDNDITMVLARIEVHETGEAIIYKGGAGKAEYKAGDLRKPTIDTFVNAFELMIKDLEPEKNWEDDKPLVKEYLNQFTPLRRGQIVKQLSKMRYNNEGVKQSTAENIIEFVNGENSHIDINSDGEKTVFANGLMLSSKLGRLAINFGIWLIEHKNMGTKGNGENAKENNEDNKPYITNKPQPKFTEGEYLIAEMPVLNKQNSLVDYIEQKDGSHKALCLVEKVLNLSPSQYDELAESLMSNHSELGGGGTATDSPYLPSDIFRKSRSEMSPEELNEINSTIYNLATVVQAEGRMTFIIDAQGYKYARYVGLYPVKTSAPEFGQTPKTNKRPVEIELELLELDRYSANNALPLLVALRDKYGRDAVENAVEKLKYTNQSVITAVMKQTGNLDDSMGLIRIPSTGEVVEAVMSYQWKALEKHEPTPEPEPIIEPTPEPIIEPTPEPIEPIMQTVEQFLDEVIKDPSKLLNSQNYEKLDNVLDNFETLSNEIQDKAEKALELYSAYSFKALADLAQNGESGPLPS